MNKEEIMLRKRFVDLSNMAYQKGIPFFTDFLSMNELNILYTTRAEELAVSYSTFGGYEFAERQMSMFVPDALFYNVEYPLKVLKVYPKYPKFAQKLEHRDYLGALIHLGVDRSVIGDIILNNDNAYIVCHEKIAQFFCDELIQIKHTAVETVISQLPEEITKPDLQEIKGTVSSLRADSVVSLALHQSRNSILDLFKSQKIFVNGKLIESNSFILKEDDIISVRGFGRFIFKSVLNKTKKDRLYILLLKY